MTVSVEFPTSPVSLGGRVGIGQETFVSYWNGNIWEDYEDSEDPSLQVAHCPTPDFLHDLPLVSPRILGIWALWSSDDTRQNQRTGRGIPQMICRKSLLCLSMV